MDRTIVANWNNLVGKDDTVYHLGDVAFATPDRIKHILENLNGRKILIIGNHDRNANRMVEYGFAEVHQSIKQLELSNGTLVNLSHYPYRGSTTDPYHEVKFDTKNIDDDGRNLICGHVHIAWDSKPGKYKNWMINVGVDVQDFKPVSEDELIQLINNAKIH